MWSGMGEILTLLGGFLSNSLGHIKLIINFFDLLFIKYGKDEITKMANKSLADIQSHSLNAGALPVLLDSFHSAALYHKGTCLVG